MIKYASLGDLVVITGGGTPSRQNPAYWGGPIPWATVKDLTTSVLCKTQESITIAAVKNCATNVISAGAIITATRMGLGKSVTNTIDVAINQDLKALQPKSSLDSRYLLHFLLSKAKFLEAMGKGATVKGIILNDLKQLQIPLPPLSEQKRIAAILDKADAIRRKRQEAIKLADDFLRATFLDMFGDPVTNPKGWKTVPLGKTVISIDGGWSVKSLDRPRTDNEWGVLKISSVTSGRLIPSENKAVFEIDKRRPILTPQKGDLLFSRANTRELVAATCIVEKDEPNLFLPDKLWRIEPNRQYVFPEYLKFLLSHRKYHEVVTAHATGTSGSMLNISKEKLRSVEIPLPGISIQKRFANILWKVYEQEAKQNQIFETSLTLSNSLIQRAFRGEL